MHRLIAAELSKTAVRLTRIRLALPADAVYESKVAPAVLTCLMAPPQMPSSIAADVAKVVAFAVEGPPSVPLLVDEVVIRPWAVPGNRTAVLPAAGF